MLTETWVGACLETARLLGSCEGVVSEERHGPRFQFE